MALPSAIVGNAAEPRLSDLIGHTGISHTALRPSGTAMLEGRRVDVLAEGEFIAQGQPIKVSRVEGASVFVRSLPTSAAELR